MDKTTDAKIPNGWRLRPATCDDVTGLHALASMPMVYRYLFDGEAPDKELIVNRIARGIGNRENTGLGMWVLERPSAPHVGCVELRPYPSPRTAEITYLLNPRYWGQGLAVRMAWTAIRHAFGLSQINAVVAGADQPNTASLAVIRRLGMWFHQNVQYPLGPGVEYVLHHDDPGPNPRPAEIHLA